MDGFILVDKPQGISSFGVVARVRWLIKEGTGQKIKIGHTGTLDPAASGLMILVLGKYTKRAAQFSKLDKTYEAEVTLGKTSTTADMEGEIIGISHKKPSPEEIRTVLKTFLGEIEQTPPAYSAIKVGGQRAYRLARAGKEVKLQPRMIRIYAVGRIKYTYPKLSFTTSVSSGTYIRSFAEDIGIKLATGAYLSGLRRTEVDGYSVRDSLDFDKLTFMTLKRALRTGVAK